MELQELKEKAAAAFAKGKFTKAAELYADYCMKDPRDLQARLRMGDAWARGGKTEKAIGAYQLAAEGFAKEGFLPRAIAASKLILELDPSHKAVQRMLADLYAQRSISPAESHSARGAEAGPARQSTSTARDRGARAFASAQDAGSEPGPEEPAHEESFQIQRAAAETLHSSAGDREFEVEEVAFAGLDTSRDVPPEMRSTGHLVKGGSAARPAETEAANILPGAARASTGEALAAKASAGSARQPVERNAPSRRAASATRPAERGSREHAEASARPSSAEPPKPPQRTVKPQSLEAESGALTEAGGLDMEVDASSAGEAFTELELDGDSLLHAVERAARLGMARRRQEAESEPVAANPARAKTPAELAPPRKLPKVPLFSDLAPEAFIELFERGPMRRFKKGERIFEQGSVGDSFYVICAGSVRVLRDQDGETKEIAVLGEGSFFGEMAILSGSPRTASVESASGETELLEISADLLSQLSARYPMAAQALKKFCRQRLLANVMSVSALFQPFDSKERRALVERFRGRDVNRGTAIVREGERSDGLYVVLSGEVSVAIAGRPLALLREGEIFGEMSLLTKAPATATVSATRRTSLLRLPREDFEEVIMSHPQILALVSELTDDRQRLTEAVIQGSAQVGEFGLILV